MARLLLLIRAAASASSRSRVPAACRVPCGCKHPFQQEMPGQRQAGGDVGGAGSSAFCDAEQEGGQREQPRGIDPRRRRATPPARVRGET